VRTTRPLEGPRTSDSVASRVTSSAGSRLDEGHPRRYLTDEEERAAMTIVRSTNRMSLTERARTQQDSSRARERRDDDDDDKRGLHSPRVQLGAASTLTLSAARSLAVDPARPLAPKLRRRRQQQHRHLPSAPNVAPHVEDKHRTVRAPSTPGGALSGRRQPRARRLRFEFVFTTSRRTVVIPRGLAPLTIIKSQRLRPIILIR